MRGSICLLAGISTNTDIAIWELHGREDEVLVEKRLRSNVEGRVENDEKKG